MAGSIKRYQWYSLEGETSRTYYWFPSGKSLHIEEPLRFMLSGTGRHYIEAAGGKNYIVAQGWSYLTFEGTKFGFSSTADTPDETPQEATK